MRPAEGQNRWDPELRWNSPVMASESTFSIVTGGNKRIGTKANWLTDLVQVLQTVLSGWLPLVSLKHKVRTSTEEERYGRMRV